MQRRARRCKRINNAPFKAWVPGSIPSEVTTLGRGFPVATQFCSKLRPANSVQVWSERGLERG